MPKVMTALHIIMNLFFCTARTTMLTLGTFTKLAQTSVNLKQVQRSFSVTGRDLSFMFFK